MDEETRIRFVCVSSFLVVDDLLDRQNNFECSFREEKTSEARSMSSTSVLRLDPELEIKTRAVIRFINETVQYNANEPSLALYRIQVKELRRTCPLQEDVFLFRNTSNELYRE